MVNFTVGGATSEDFGGCESMELKKQVAHLVWPPAKLTMWNVVLNTA